MTEQELRAIVRDAIDRHLHGGAERPRAYAEPGSAAPPPTASVAVSLPRVGVAAGALAHPSHGMFLLSAGTDAEGRCVIEPAVACTHCGYCKSYGH